MKRIKYFIMLFVFLLLPKTVFAYQLMCDDNVIDYNQNLFCHLIGEKNQNFEVLSGNINSTDNLISCTLVSYAKGLSIIDDQNSFSLIGVTKEETLITFNCQLNEKLNEVKRTQIKIDDFKYKLEYDEYETTNEIISTDFINANIYNEEIETDDKPRNTSNSDTLLKTLYEDNLNLTFSRFVTIYNQEVLYEVEDLNLNIIPYNLSSTIRIVGNGEENNTKLNVGENIIDIYVTAKNGAVTCYTLNVTRLSIGEEIYYPEKDASLFSLIIPGYAISFNKDVYEYKLHIANDISKITVNAVPTYDEANVSISSTEDLKNGSVIKVTVTSKDKSTNKDYTILITKDAPKTDYTPYIVLGLVSIVLIVFVVLFIKTSQNKKNNPRINPNIGQGNNTIDSNNNVASVILEENFKNNLNQVSTNTSITDLNNNVVTSIDDNPTNIQNNQNDIYNQEIANNNEINNK